MMVFSIQAPPLRRYAVLVFSLALPLVTPEFAASQQARAPEAHWQPGFVPMRDGAELAYLLYKPAKEGQFPVLVTYDGYSGGGTSLRQEELELLGHGYAVLGVSVRGTGASGGVFPGPFTKQEGEDGKAVIEWVGTQPWCDGNVGMYGTVYAGICQFEVAAQRPRYLKALAAGSVWGDSYEDVGYPGGIFNVGLIGTWSFYSQPYFSSRGARVRGMAGPAAGAGIASPAAGKSFEEMRGHPFKDAWWAERNFEDAASQIEAPTMICQGWQDQQAGSRGAVRLFERLKVPKRIMLSNGGEGTFALAAMRAERIRWFDRWLKGQQNGVDKEPPVTIWFETREQKPQPKGLSDKGSKALEKSQAIPRPARLSTPPRTDSKPAWVSGFSAWPIPETVWSTFYLTDGGELAAGKPSSQIGTGKRVYLYPAGTEVVSTNETFSAPPVPVGSLWYRTPPLREDMTIIGSPVVTLYVSSEQNMAVLHDIVFDDRTLKGQATYIQRGFLRASHRALDPKKTSPHEPIHRHDKAEDLEPGKIYEVKFSLFPVGHTVRRGHSLELAIMAPPAIPSPSWGFAPVMLPGVITVHHSRESLSRLELPVVPNLKAQAPAPAFGSLPLQPARELLPNWDGQRKTIDELLQFYNPASEPRR
jgi:predicted acyl esterase